MDRRACYFVIGLLFCIHPIRAQVQPAKSTQELDRPPEIPDAELWNQRGEKIHFYSDLVKGHVVAIQSIFTTCTTLCPLLGTTFSHLQDTLGDRARDVRLISISVDPATDTPERLKAWGARYHAGPNWTMVTGNKYEVDRVLRALKFYTADKLSHTALVLVGNDATGHWARTSGFVPAARITEMVKSLMPPLKSGSGSGTDDRFSSSVSRLLAGLLPVPQPDKLSFSAAVAIVGQAFPLVKPDEGRLLPADRRREPIVCPTEVSCAS